MTARPPSFASLLTENGSAIDAAQAQKLLDVFLRVCAALDITEPSDPQAPQVARALVAMVLEGETDPQVLHARALAPFQQKN